MTNEPILYVEDEPDYQLVVSRILKGAGYASEMASTGEEGLELLTRRRPSLVILDINLPDTTGYEICNRIRKEPAWADLPVLMLTVRRKPEEWLDGFSHGADDYVTKPLNPPQFLERVKTCLEVKPGRILERDNPERQLIGAVKSGNRLAFDVLIQRYRGPLLHKIRERGVGQGEAEDIVSHVFVKAFEWLDRFRGESEFFTWLHAMVNQQLARRKYRPEPVPLDSITEDEESHASTQLQHDDPQDPHNVRQEDVLSIYQALDHVDEPYRRMLVWRFINGMSYRAIANRMNIPPGTVMSRLFTARNLLREAWLKLDR